MVVVGQPDDRSRQVGAQLVGRSRVALFNTLVRRALGGEGF